MGIRREGSASGRGEGEGQRSAGRGGEPREVRLSAYLPGARFVACDDIVARGCHDDLDACRPGDVFVARVDDDADGHELAARASLRGVAGIVAERMIPTFGTPLCLVPDSVWARARLAHALAGDPARGMRVIAVTGTSGKTTTAWLAASVLAEGGAEVGVLSDLGCLDASAVRPVGGNWQSPDGLARWLARLAEGGCSHAVVEVSSAMLARHALAGVDCDTVAVTNLGRAHLDRHGTVEAYHAIKARIVDALGGDGCLVGNVDDRRVAALLAGRSAARGHDSVRGVGLLGDADLTATAVDRGLGGQTFLVRHAGDSAAVTVAAPLASFVRDCLCAAAIGLREGMPLHDVARGIEAAGAVPGRLEAIRRGQDVHVFVDQPTSGHALASTLSGLRRLTAGRLVLLADERAVQRFDDPARFARRAERWCETCLVVPADLLDSGAGERQLAAYARIDRLLGGLGPRDCVLVVGEACGERPDPGDPGEPQSTPLAVVVDAWLQLANRPLRGAGWHRAA